MLAEYGDILVKAPHTLTGQAILERLLPDVHCWGTDLLLDTLDRSRPAQ